MLLCAISPQTKSFLAKMATSWRLIPTLYSDVCGGDGLPTMGHERRYEGLPLQPTYIILVRNCFKWRRRAHHVYLNTCTSARLTMTVTRDEATTCGDDGYWSDMTMTDEDDMFAHRFSCSDPAASSSDHSATPVDQCPKPQQNYQLITARS